MSKQMQLPLKPVVNQNLIAAVGAGLENDLSAGVGSGYAVLGFRASKWRIKHASEETLITNDEGETIPSLELVLLKASPTLAKTYYEGKYQEGSNDPPDCWSSDGKRPDPSIESPVNSNCVTCPKNAFGSRVSDNNSRGKACQDVRRVVVLPLGDLPNELYGGPMLLRVPPASLQDLATYGRQLLAQGFPYNAIGTRVGFDPDASYPKLTFKAIRVLSEAEQEQLVNLMADGEFASKVEYILNSNEDARAAAPVQAAAPAPAPAPVKPKAVDTTFEVPPPAASKATAKAAAPAKATGGFGKKAAPAAAQAAPAPAAAAAPPPPPVAEVDVDDTGDDSGAPSESDVDDILSSLGLGVDG